MVRILSSVRKVARTDDWWFSKIAPLAAVALFLILLADPPVAEGSATLLCVFISIFCVAAYGHVVNDVTDVVADARAGRRNAMFEKTASQRSLALILPLACGFAPGFLVGYPPLGWLLLVANYLCPTLYSIPPIRMKERGLWGILLDAAGSHVTPTLFVLVVLSELSPFPEMPGFVRGIVIVLWSTVLGLKGILYHQLAHLPEDSASKTKTWARSIGRDRLARFLPRLNLAIELPANVALALAFLPWCPLTGIFLIVYILIETIKNRLGFEFALDQDPRNRRPAVPFSNDLFYDCWLPLSVAIQLTLLSPEWIWIPVLVLIVFGRNYRTLLRDLSAVGRHLLQRLRSRGG